MVLSTESAPSLLNFATLWLSTHWSWQMDVNGTRFHLLLGKNDWGNCTVEGEGLPKEKLSEIWKTDEGIENKAAIGVEWNATTCELTLQTRLVNFVASPQDTPPDISQRRGAACDRYGNWFWIDETNLEIKVLSIGSQNVTTYFPIEQSDDETKQKIEGEFYQFEPKEKTEPIKLSGLAITEDHYMIVGTSQPAGILVFDLYSTGEPRQILFPKEIPFAPFDMSPRKCGGACVLDRENKTLWLLDRYFNFVNPAKQETVLTAQRDDEFQPLDKQEKRGIAEQTFPQGIALNLTSPPTDFDPIAIETLSDEKVFILDGKKMRDDESSPFYSRIFLFDVEKQTYQIFKTSSLLALLGKDADSKMRLDAHDIAFVAAKQNDEKILGKLYAASSGGNQTFAFEVKEHETGFELQPLSEFLPMRLFGGKGIVAAGEQVFYDFDNRWIPLIQQRRPRFAGEALIITDKFNGKEPDCVWHRLLIDACIPPETKAEVWSRAANSEDELELTEWQHEPSLYLRGNGSELPFAKRLTRTKNQPDKKQTVSGDGTWELLFQKAHGQYLQLKLRLSGNERSTPRLFAMRIYYPRFSYSKNYLPAVYREDELSASFLERFLANVEGTYTAIEDKIAAVQMLFDARSVPAESLDWLASWFGVALDPAWDEAKRRLFIQNAPLFFQYRGTLRGLLMALHLAFDSCADKKIFDEDRFQSKNPRSIRIVEKFQTQIATTSQQRQDAAHRFSVLLPYMKTAASHLKDPQEQIEFARRIVTLEKPTHTVFDVKFYWALFRIGEARLGEDTLLDEGSRSPQLMPPMILGQNYVGESFIEKLSNDDCRFRLNDF
jgi:phage tail-like protein